MNARTNKKGDTVRRILSLLIESGALDRWVSAKDLAHRISTQYALGKKSGGGDRRRRQKNISTNQVATCLAEFKRRGLVDQKRKNPSAVSLWRKV